MKKSKTSILYSALLILGVLILINILSERFFFRIDLTEDNRYTLSDATKDLLHELPEPVTVKAYFSENLPPDIENVRTEFKDLLVEYATRSNDMVVYEFINPNEDKATEQKAMQQGIMPIQINQREKDQVKMQRAFLGAVIQMGEQSEVIPVIQSVEGMEYALSSAIKKLSVIEKPVVGVLQGHGEPNIRQLSQVRHELEILYEVQPVRLSDTTNELEKINTLAVIAPKDSFKNWELEQMNQFLQRGASILIALNRVDAELSRQQRGTVVSTGLSGWLKEKGIVVNDNFVIDESSASIGVQMQQGPFVVNQQVPFPYFPIITNFAEHPVSKGLEAVIMQFASSIEFNGDSAISYTPLALTSERAGIESAPKYFNIQKNWTKKDFPMSGIPVAAAIEGPIVNTSTSKMIVIADGDLATNPEGQQGNQINPDNVSLMVNSMDWLSDDTGLIELRTKGVTARPIEDMEDSKRTFIKILNFSLPILLIIIIGIIRYQNRQSLRIKRMEVDYVQ